MLKTYLSYNHFALSIQKEYLLGKYYETTIMLKGMVTNYTMNINK